MSNRTIWPLFLIGIVISFTTFVYLVWVPEDTFVHARTIERNRISQAMQKSLKVIPVSNQYINELLKKMELTPTGRAIALKLRIAIKSGDIVFLYKHQGHAIASFQQGSKGTGVMYLDTRNYLGINDPSNRAGKSHPLKGLHTADFFNVGIVVHEAVHFITHQARYQGKLKGGKGSIEEETVAYAVRYDYIEELKNIRGINQVIPDAYSDAASLPWNKNVIAYEKKLDSYKVNGKYDLVNIAFDENASRLLKAIALNKKYSIFDTVRKEIKNGVVKGPLDYIAQDRASKDDSYSNTANFLLRRLPAYWNNDHPSKKQRRNYHKNVQKIINGLKNKGANTL